MADPATRHSVSRLARVAALVAAGVLLVALLQLTAQRLVSQGIDREAAGLLRTYAAGTTPWDRAPRRLRDLVAGRVFGTAGARATEGALVFTSTDDTPYALGLPLPWPLDLERFPVAEVVLEAEVPVEVSWQLRAGLDTPLLLSGAVRLDPAARSHRIDLGSLDWHEAAGTRAQALPRHAAMLRVELRHAAGTEVGLRAVRWHQREASGDFVPLLRRLPAGSVERILELRDAWRAATPAAVIATRHLPPAGSANDRWLAAGGRLLPCLILLLALGAIAASFAARRRPGRGSSRPLALLQIAACLAPFACWALGMQGPTRPGTAWLLASAPAFGLALWLAARTHGTSWVWLHWAGRASWRDWLAPACTTALVLAFLLVWQAQPRPLPAGGIATYLAWAALQQILMLAVVTPRLRLMVPGAGFTALLVAGLFALLHAPNGLLMQGALLAQFVWTRAFLQRPVLLPLIVAHAVAGILLAATLGQLPLRSLEVGARFLQ